MIIIKEDIKNIQVEQVSYKHAAESIKENTSKQFISEEEKRLIQDNKTRIDSIIEQGLDQNGELFFEGVPPEDKTNVFWIENS